MTTSHRATKRVSGRLRYSTAIITPVPSRPRQRPARDYGYRRSTAGTRETHTQHPDKRVPRQQRAPRLLLHVFFLFFFFWFLLALHHALAHTAATFHFVDCAGKEVIIVAATVTATVTTTVTATVTATATVDRQCHFTSLHFTSSPSPVALPLSRSHTHTHTHSHTHTLTHTHTNTLSTQTHSHTIIHAVGRLHLNDLRLLHCTRQPHRRLAAVLRTSSS